MLQSETWLLAVSLRWLTRMPSGLAWVNLLRGIGSSLKPLNTRDEAPEACHMVPYVWLESSATWLEPITSWMEPNEAWLEPNEACLEPLVAG